MQTQLFQCVVALGQAKPGDNLDPIAVVVVLALAATAAWTFIELTKERKKLRALAQQLSQARAAANEQGANPERERNQVMFEQHKQMNALQIAKLSAEVEMLRVQAAKPDEVRDRFEAGKEYHELMVEKTRLEIESLRLHVVELRKRLEDWRSDAE
jgi:hypothetical protein